MSDKKTFHNIIDGQVQASASGATMDIINPSTGAVYATAPMSDEHDVDLACQASAKAFEKWRWTTPGERQNALLKLADVIEDNVDELVAIECENTGKPISLTVSEEIPQCSTRSASSPAPRACSRALVRRVHEGLHVVRPPRAGRPGRARSRRGTTR